MKKAVARFDALPYDEPHGWLMSSRQTIAALLTEQGHYERATKAYEEDLTLFPKNPWALAGLSRCYAATKDGRLPEVKVALEEAGAVADIPSAPVVTDHIRVIESAQEICFRPVVRDGPHR